LKILTTVKKVVDVELTIRVESGAIVEEGLQYVMNAWDENAVEASVQLKEIMVQRQRWSVSAAAMTTPRLSVAAMPWVLTTVSRSMTRNLPERIPLSWPGYCKRFTKPEAMIWS